MVSLESGLERVICGSLGNGASIDEACVARVLRSHLAVVSGAANSVAYVRDFRLLLEIFRRLGMVLNRWRLLCVAKPMRRSDKRLATS